MSPIRHLAVSWLTNAAVLAVVTVILTRVTVSSAGALIIAAAVFGVLNTFLKPLAKLLTLPLAVVTLGLAWFGVSMLMLFLTEKIVSGFHIHGFSTFIWATIIVWLVNLVLDVVPGPWHEASSN